MHETQLRTGEEVGMIGPAPRDRLVSPEQFAAFLAIGRRTFQTWRAIGKLPPPDLALGKVLRWRWATIEAWLEARKPSSRS